MKSPLTKRRKKRPSTRASAVAPPHVVALQALHVEGVEAYTRQRLLDRDRAAIPAWSWGDDSPDGLMWHLWSPEQEVAAIARSKRHTQRLEAGDSWWQTELDVSRRISECLWIWVEAWFTLGKDLAALIEQTPDLQESATSLYRAETRCLTFGGTNHPTIIRRISERELSVREEAARLMIALGTSPIVSKVRLLPCCRGACKRQFVDATRRNKRLHCSRECGNLDSARRQRSIDDARADLKKVAKVISALPQIPDSKWREAQWKQWICDRVGCKKNWLTRRIDSGEVLLDGLAPHFERKMTRKRKKKS